MVNQEHAKALSTAIRDALLSPGEVVATRPSIILLVSAAEVLRVPKLRPTYVDPKFRRSDSHPAGRLLQSSSAPELVLKIKWIERGSSFLIEITW